MTELLDTTRLWPVVCVVGARPNFIKMAPISRALKQHVPPLPVLIVHTGQHYDADMSDHLYTTERTAAANLSVEGISKDIARFVGKVMVDSLIASKPYARNARDTLTACKVDASILDKACGYGVVTLHRPSNVDEPGTLRTLLETLGEVAAKVPLVFALHPRTRSSIERFKLISLIDPANFVLLPPQGYLEMLGLLTDASLVLTDSGGLQEETTALDVPCLTLRENTERPITVEQGTSILVGTGRKAILAAVDDILAGRGKHGCTPELWDGRAAERIASDLWQWLRQKSPQPNGPCAVVA